MNMMSWSNLAPGVKSNVNDFSLGFIFFCLVMEIFLYVFLLSNAQLHVQFILIFLGDIDIAIAGYIILALGSFSSFSTFPFF